MSELNWSDDQRKKVDHAVEDAFEKTRVARTFLDCYKTVTGSAETVRNERLSEDGLTVSLDGDHDGANLKLVNLTVKVELSSEQVSEESLSNAILAFRRAASILAQEEDRIVFEGYHRGRSKDDSPFVANSIKPQKGLADMAARQEFPDVNLATKDTGQEMVTAVVEAIRSLEDNSNTSPFACVLGNELFNAAYTPAPSLVLPADRITPLLKGGPLLRSGQMNPSTGIVVSLAGKAIDLVVGTPPTVQLLHRTEDAKYLFRVYERFVLRIRDKKKPPVAGFVMRTAGAGVEEAAVLEASLTARATVLHEATLEVAHAIKTLAAARAHAAAVAGKRPRGAASISAEEEAVRDANDALQRAKERLEQAEQGTGEGWKSPSQPAGGVRKKKKSDPPAKP